MPSDPVPPLRCEIRRPSREPVWLAWGLTLVLVTGALVDALWLVPAQRGSRPSFRQSEVPAAAPTTRRTVTRVDGVLLATPR
jgi:hypothetical protein